ncbi:MAG: intS 3 [Proteobacteria bacterium]|nr:intS 3 [Pseudomonadota bacterium]
MSLNDTKIRSLKPSAKPFKVSDSHGLYLIYDLIRPELAGKFPC